MRKKYTFQSFKDVNLSFHFTFLMTNFWNYEFFNILFILLIRFTANEGYYGTKKAVF